MVAVQIFPTKKHGGVEVLTSVPLFLIDIDCELSFILLPRNYLYGQGLATDEILKYIRVSG